MKFLVSKLQETEDINFGFHYKFNLLQKNAELSLKRNQQIHKQIKSYQENTEITQNVLLNRRKKQFNELEFNVYTIKEKTAEIEEHLKSIKESFILVEKEIVERNHMNIILKMENKVKM